MAAKIRAMELLPNVATDTEYLKLYGVIFLGWLLTGVGTSMFFGGVPLLPAGGAVRGLLGILLGGVVWVAGLVPLFAGIVALAQKVILETTREEMIGVDRLVADEPASGGDAPGNGGSSGDATVHAGARPSETHSSTEQSRVEDADDSG